MRLLAALLVATMASATALADDDRCTVPDELAVNPASLPRVQAALAQGKALTIVVVGGSSTVGAAAGSPDAAFPARLEAELRARFPDTKINVINAGRPRDATRAMADRMSALLLDARPQLVIWETGTMEAVRRGDVGEFEEALHQGITAARARGADVMLMDFQYGRGPSALIDFEPYTERLYGAADVDQVPVFQRYEMMRHWSEAGTLDLADTRRDRQAATAAALYDCIAKRLADAFKVKP